MVQPKEKIKAVIECLLGVGLGKQIRWDFFFGIFLKKEKLRFEREESGACIFQSLEGDRRI